jgi:aminopeptidase N
MHLPDSKSARFALATALFASALPLFDALRIEPALDATPGADGLGDELFPKLGNGGYDALDYDITLAVDMSTGSIDALAKISAKATQNLSRFNLDLTGLDVKSVQVDGAAATFAREGGELEITPAKPLAEGKTFEASVAYSGVPKPIPDPSIPIEGLGWLRHDGEIYVLSEPFGASSFMPINDHPRDKATYTFRVTVPKPLVVAGNGALTEKKEAGDKITYVWRTRDPMASYLATIAIGEFVVDESKGKGGLAITNYYSPKVPAKQREPFAKQGEILAFYGDKFGAYPFETAGGILASIDLPGALETQTKPTYGAGAAGESTIAHELAHQWFGNCVSFNTWRDIWVAEGFAEYSAWLWAEHSQGADAFQRDVLRAYGMVSRAPIEPPGKVDEKTLFGGGVYARGPLVLHALRLEVGDETFFKILRTWVEAHKNGVASDEDFIAHATAIAKRDMKPLLSAWLYDEKAPKIASLDEALAAKQKAKDAKKPAGGDKKKD